MLGAHYGAGFSKHANREQGLHKHGKEDRKNTNMKACQESQTWVRSVKDV